MRWVTTVAPKNADGSLASADSRRVQNTLTRNYKHGVYGEAVRLRISIITPRGLREAMVSCQELCYTYIHGVDINDYYQSPMLIIN